MLVAPVVVISRVSKGFAPPAPQNTSAPPVAPVTGELLCHGLTPQGDLENPQF